MNENFLLGQKFINSKFIQNHSKNIQSAKEIQQRNQNSSSSSSVDSSGAITTVPSSSPNQNISSSYPTSFDWISKGVRIFV